MMKGRTIEYNKNSNCISDEQRILCPLNNKQSNFLVVDHTHVYNNFLKETVSAFSIGVRQVFKGGKQITQQRARNKTAVGMQKYILYLNP
jgi:hypothetical protein